MGKGTNLVNGVISGRVGAQVGYKLSNPNRPQGVRAYQPNVYNPRTYRQAAHRAKVRPAHLFYLAFEPILNHAFFPTGSAGANRRRFISLAMRNAVIPRVLKGENSIPYNVPYQVSQGDLPLDSMVKGTAGEGSQFEKHIVFENFVGFDDWTQDIASVSSYLIENSALSNGDEITFLMLSLENNIVIPHFSSLVLNINDNLNTCGYIEDNNIDLNDMYGENDCLTISSIYNIALAAAIIISRRDGDRYHYTNSFMAMSQYAIDNLSPSEQAVIESYMNALAASSDKLLQLAQQADTSVRIVGVENVRITPAVGYSLQNFSEEGTVVAVYNNGFKRIVLKDVQLIYWLEGLLYEPIIYSSGGNNIPAIISMTTYNNCPTVSLEEVQAAGFLLNEA